jgi:hypothetical protein
MPFLLRKSAHSTLSTSRGALSRSGQSPGEQPQSRAAPRGLLFRFVVPLPGPRQASLVGLGVAGRQRADPPHQHPPGPRRRPPRARTHPGCVRPGPRARAPRVPSRPRPRRLDPDVPHAAARRSTSARTPTARRATPSAHHPLAHVHPGGTPTEAERTALGAPCSHPSATRSGRPPPRERPVCGWQRDERYPTVATARGLRRKHQSRHPHAVLTHHRCRLR